MDEGINSMVETIQELEKENAELKLRLGSVSHRFSDKQIVEMALEMIYQMTGERVLEEEQCRHQGNANYQIAMTYLTKVNGG